MSSANHSQLSICLPKLFSVSGQQHVLNEHHLSVNITVSSLCCNENWYLGPSAKRPYMENEKMKTKIFMIRLVSRFSVFLEFFFHILSSVPGAIGAN